MKKKRGRGGKTRAARHTKLSSLNRNFRGNVMRRLSLKNKKMLAPMKRRHFFPWKNHELTFGTGGLRILDRLYFPYKLFRGFRIIIKYTLSKNTKAIRFYIWIRSLFTVAMTRKSNKSRMGRGKGKLLYYMGILSSGCFFVEALGPHPYRMRKFFSWLSVKLPVRSCSVIRGFTHGVGFSKFVSYKFMHILGMRIHYIYRLRHLHKLFIDQRRITNYAPLSLRSCMQLNISPFGFNKAVHGYGRCLTLHQSISNGGIARDKYKPLIYQYMHRFYYRKLNTNFYYFLMNRRVDISKRHYNRLSWIFWNKPSTDLERIAHRAVRRLLDYVCISSVQIINKNNNIISISNNVLNYAYII